MCVHVYTHKTPVLPFHRNDTTNGVDIDLLHRIKRTNDMRV